MAQRMVHYVFGQRLAELCGIPDGPRFLLGNLLPDAIRDKAERGASHFASLGEDGARCYEFNRFRRDFSSRMDDPLYLGYYMHLVTDCFYREYCYRICEFSFRTDADVRALHRDYHLLNPYLVRRYRLTNRLVLPADFGAEPLARVARFDLPGLAEDLANDYSERPEGVFTYLSAGMADDFIARYFPAAEAELCAVLRGEYLFRAAALAWRKRNE